MATSLRQPKRRKALSDEQVLALFSAFKERPETSRRSLAVDMGISYSAVVYWEREWSAGRTIDGS